MTRLLKEKEKQSLRPRKENQNWSEFLEKKLERTRKLQEKSLRPRNVLKNLEKIIS